MIKKIKQLIEKKCLFCNDCFIPNYRQSQSFCNNKCRIEQWKLNNINHLKEYKRRWYNENQNRILNIQKEYRINNKEKRKIWRAGENGIYSEFKNTAKQRRIKLEITKKQLNKIKKRDKVCVYCNTNKSDGFEHIIPITRQGKTNFNNLVCSCNSCNASKRNYGLFEWTEKDYCKDRNINLNTINPIALNLLEAQHE